MTNDPHRPAYHFAPASNWMNDPNGIIQWNGRYHLFYQYNPAGPFHGTIHWGHAASDDLVHWEHLPVALAPTPDSPDADGVWSGCAVDNGGTPTFVYTGLRHTEAEKYVQRPCLATALDDDLVSWEKFADNPVIDAPPNIEGLMGFRDHCVWRQDDQWYHVIGSGVRGEGGAALLYRSPNLVDWEYLGPLCTGNVTETGSMWECPDFFPLHNEQGESGEHVLFVSSRPVLDEICLIGQYDGERFTPDHHFIFDYGRYDYAAMSKLVDDGRRLQWGWLKEGRTRQAQVEAGWSGAMSLPREIFAHENGDFGVRPVPELQALRGEPMSLEAARGDCLEIIAEIARTDARQVGLKLRCSPDGQEQTVLYYDRGEHCVTLDRTRSSLDPGADRDRRIAPLNFTFDDEHPLRLHIFLDRSTLEIFVNERIFFASRLYPTRADSDGIELHAFSRDEDGVASVNAVDAFRSFRAWPLRSIW